MGKIATEQEAYSIAGGSNSTTSKICCTKARAVQIGCEVKGSYAESQLVQKDNLAQGINYLTVNVEGEKVSVIPKYKEIPQDTISNMRFVLVFSDGVIVGQGLIFNWDEAGKYWWIYSRKIPSPDAVLDSARSSLTIKQDSKYNYAFASSEKQKIKFQFVLYNSVVYLNLEEPGYAEFDGPIVTNIGNFFIDPQWYYSGANSQTVPSGFDINSIVVQEIPTSSSVELEQGKFLTTTYTINYEDKTGELSMNGHLVTEIGAWRDSHGVTSTGAFPFFFCYGKSMYLTYNGMGDNSYWKVRVGSQSYDLKQGVKTDVGYFYGDTTITLVQYVR